MSPCGQEPHPAEATAQRSELYSRTRLCLHELLALRSNATTFLDAYPTIEHSLFRTDLAREVREPPCCGSIPSSPSIWRCPYRVQMHDGFAAASRCPHPFLFPSFFLSFISHSLHLFRFVSIVSLLIFPQ